MAYTAFFTGPGSEDILKFIVPNGSYWYLTFDQNPSDVAYSVSVNGHAASVYKLPQYAIRFQPGVYSILYTDLGYDPSATFDLSPTLPPGFPLVATPLPSSWVLLLSSFVGLGFLVASRGTKKNSHRSRLRNRCDRTSESPPREASFAAQAIEHDADLLFGRMVSRPTLSARSSSA